MASNLRQTLNAFLDAIVFSNIWISLAALSLHLFVIESLHLKSNIKVALFIFLGTFIAYNFLKFRGLHDKTNRSIFFEWMRKHKLILQILLIIACVICCYLMLFLELSQYLVLLISGFTTLLYLGVDSFNLRRFWFLKTPIVGLVWTLILLVLTLVPIESALLNTSFIYSALFVYFLVVGLTIPFEIRDLKVDLNAQGATTMPMQVGLTKTKLIAIFHLLLALIFLLQFNQEAYAVILLVVFAAKKIVALEHTSSEYDFSFVLDGILVAIYPSLVLTQYLLSLITY